MEDDLGLILEETARLARDFGFGRTADMLDEVLEDLRGRSHPDVDQPQLLN